MIKIQISNEALDDLADGFWFYEAQEAGLGDYFASQIKADIEGLKVTAGIHKQSESGYLRLLSRKFPYAIYYTSTDDVAVVWAVVDCRRNPEWIRKHLES
jgi:plasmid stabilization system protein ParE